MLAALIMLLASSGQIGAHDRPDGKVCRTTEKRIPASFRISKSVTFCATRAELSVIEKMRDKEIAKNLARPRLK